MGWWAGNNWRIVGVLEFIQLVLRKGLYSSFEANDLEDLEDTALLSSVSAHERALSFVFVSLVFSLLRLSALEKDFPLRLPTKEYRNINQVINVQPEHVFFFII